MKFIMELLLNVMNFKNKVMTSKKSDSFYDNNKQKKDVKFEYIFLAR